ncbi:MAG: hypothetical protein JWR26_4448 [Pedosphaera sp.]|nr:hypothetical protein [Pedosphaera sp.]
MVITAGSFIGTLGPFDLLSLVALGLFWLILMVKIHLKLSYTGFQLCEEPACLTLSQRAGASTRGCLRTATMGTRKI